MAAAKWTESTVFRAACLVLVVAHVELVSGDSGKSRFVVLTCK